VLAFAGSLVALVCCFVLVHGWPGVRQITPTRTARTAAPAKTQDRRHTVVLGGGVRTTMRPMPPRRGASRPPGERGGVAGAADDVVKTLDDLIP
jgi:hypothetical protein